MSSTLTMAKTLLKIFSRDRQAIFFTLFFPITFMVIFGIASRGGDDPIEIGIVDHAANAFSEQFIETLRIDHYKFNLVRLRLVENRNDQRIYADGFSLQSLHAVRGPHGIDRDIAESVRGGFVAATAALARGTIGSSCRSSSARTAT